MPKNKTHKGLKKRVKVTAKGKVKTRRSGSGHLLSGKTAKQRRQMASTLVVNDVFSKTMKEMLGVNK